MNLTPNIIFYSESLPGHMEVVKAINRTNELIVTHRIPGQATGKQEIWPLDVSLRNFKSGMFYMKINPELELGGMLPTEVSIIRMALPALRDRLQGNIDALTIGTAGCDILFEKYEDMLRTTDTLIKKLNC